MTGQVLWALGGLAAASLLLVWLSALVERSGPIRLRHWAEEAGGSLRSLYEHHARFEALGLLLLVLRGAAILALFWVASARWPSTWPLRGEAAGFLLALAWMACGEISYRILLAPQAEGALRVATPILALVGRALAPIVLLLSLLLRRSLDREEDEDDDEASAGEIQAYIDVGRREGILEDEEGQWMKGLVEFGDTQVRSVMTPRVDLICAPMTASHEELMQLFIDSGRSRIPIFADSIDQVVGVLHIRDLARGTRGEVPTPIPQLVQAPYFVPETKPLGRLLTELQALHQEMAVVVDEYGGTEGLVTIEDILEEIFGEIVDEHDDSEPVRLELPDGSYRLEGKTHVEELGDIFGVGIEEGPYETVGGLISTVLGHVPEVGESLETHGLKLLVEKADHRRVRLVRVSRLVAVERP